MNFKLKNINRSIYSVFFFAAIVSGFIFTVSFSLKNRVGWFEFSKVVILRGDGVVN